MDIEPYTAAVKDLRQVAARLSLVYYERYKRFPGRSAEYRMSVTVNPITLTQAVSVHSLHDPDAPPRVFLLADARCSCPDRLAELDMCVHEIIAKDGFHESLFLEMHFEREALRGSTHGWTPQNDNAIDELIGFQPEVMEVGTAGLDLLSVAGSGTDVLPSFDNEGTAEGGAFTQPSQGVSPGSLPVERGLASMSRRHVDNIMQAILAGYGGYITERKYAVSMLAVKLQEIMTLDAGSVKSVTGHGELTVDVPLASTVANQPKNCKIPRSKRILGVQTKRLEESVQHLASLRKS